MLSDSEDGKLSALRAASRDGDTASVAGIWRELTPREQEDVVFTLLGVQIDASTELMAPEPDEADLAMSREAETAALEPIGQTVMTPRLVEDLQGLSGSQNDRTNFFQVSPAGPSGLTEYRSRWLQRWKWSMLVGAWAVTTIFAFTANVTAFGPMEWFVAIFASVVGGGLLVGTLLNFAVAAIPLRAPEPESTQGT
jgi:hypothetical protein